MRKTHMQNRALRHRMTCETVRCVQNTVGTGCVEEVAFRLEKDPEAHSLGGWSGRAGRVHSMFGDSSVAGVHVGRGAGPGRRALKVGLAFIQGHILRPRELPKVSEQRSDVSRSGSSVQRI